MAGPTKNKPRIFYGWYMVAAFMFIALATTGARNAFGVFVIPMEEEFDWNRTTVTAAGFIGAVVSGVIQPFLGRIFDATGGRKIIIVGLIGIGVTLILLSLTFHMIFLILMFGVFTSVAAGGVSINNTSVILARWFRRRRATVMGLNAAGASLGGMVIVPFAMFLLQAINWRLTWVALGMLILVLAGIFGLALLSGNLGLWLFALIIGFSWWATLPLTTSLTADVYGTKTLGTISGVSFTFHQIGAASGMFIAAVLYDLTGSYTIPFLIVGFLLFPAAFSAFSVKERKYSSRYVTTTAVAAATGD